MGEWKNLRVLGRGSYGTVYLASIQNLKVAVKSSSNFFLSVASLHKEKNILELFKGCKEILQYYFYKHTVEGGYVISNLCMEYAPYGSLGDLIREEGPLSEKEVISYTHMLLKGLSCIHKKGVVHCDLKPDNILLFPSSDGHSKYQLKIADFGLSRTREEENSNLGEIKFRGTPLYMSPESIIGLVESSLDIWSLGCIVIEMITGFPAWRNVQTKEELMWKLGYLQEAPTTPYGLSWDCANFLSKCFVKDYRLRWSASMLLHHPFIQKQYHTSPLYNPSSFFSYDIVSYV
ncbi:unnamed protein product [Sphenostylis stenocarpa]|uniref:Protein kinase domain-containing protein n=1 Tax=Sphenostylis stenocarpa TaxID=92480 RepID=A0AA86SVC8_9FABA|nr:unnamed protein product [Sphenostylis stenocarpa]